MSGIRQALPSRRRALRGAGWAGLVVAAAAADTVVGPGTARADNGGNVVLGVGNTATLPTTITNTTAGEAAFAAFATAANTSGISLFGQTDNGLGIKGLATNNGIGVEGVGDTGLHGVGDSGPGVHGESNTGVGVWGFSQNNWGVSASSDTNTGLQAGSNSGVAVVATSGKTGVYAQSGTHDGYAVTSDAIRGYTDAAMGAGVRGENFFGGDGVTGHAGGTVNNPAGHGVSGTTNSDTAGNAGVAGTNKGAGPGVHGVGGTGVLAEASAKSSSIALSVRGPARFSLSGLITINAGSSKATVSGVVLTPASMVLATLQQSLPGIYVEAAVPDLQNNSVTVHLNKAVTQHAKVAWFAVN